VVSAVPGVVERGEEEIGGSRREEASPELHEEALRR